MKATYSLTRLAKVAKAELHGDGSKRVGGVNTLKRAAGSDISFLANTRYRNELLSTLAGAVILDAGALEICPCPALVTTNPYAAFARVAWLFYARPDFEAGVHPTAVVDANASIDATATVAAHAVVGADAVVGPGAVVGPASYLGARSVLGAQSKLSARVTVLDSVRIGERVLVHAGAVIGSDGFGLALDGDQWIKVPQMGGVVIGDDCEIGANTTIDRGALQDTVLEADVRLDNQIQIAHNVHIGAHTAMAGCAAVAGSASIGRHCMIGGGAGILGHLRICDRVVVTAMTLVTHSIKTPGEYSSGTPLQDNVQWRRNAVRMKYLDQLARRVRRLEGER